jgi:DNA-binding LacI/PurR family transcriptional regulator
VTPSIDDVARLAGVSTATVSRALRGLPNVTDATRAAVLRIAAEVGYVPSRSASALASGHTKSVGLVVPAISRWFFASLLEGAELTLRAANYDALLYSLPDSVPPRQRFDPDVLRSRVDAVMVASMYFSEQEVEALSSLGVPAVFVSVIQPGFPHVGIDDDAAARVATGHLISLGHEVIGHICGLASDQSPSAPTTRRREGWRAALKAAGLDAAPDLEHPADMSLAGGYAAALALLERRPDITALFASSDETAIGAIRAVREKGLVVGRDISVIGIDGHNIGEFAGLSTVAQDVNGQGAQAARILLDLIGSGNRWADQVVFPTHLIVRESTGPRV